MDIQSLQNMLNPQPQGTWNFDNLNLPDIGADDISISNSTNTVAPPKIIEKSADIIQTPKEFSTPDFENILIKTILERPEFFNKVKPILKSNIFGSIANSKLYDLICDYYAEYKTTPKISELYLQIEGISNPEMRRISKLKVEEVQKSEIVSTSFMDDYTVQYIKNQMFEQALIAGADFVDRRIESSKTKARELIEESQKVSIHTNLGDTFSDYADRLAYYQNPEKGLLYKRFQSFNRYLGEGILEGTLNVFMAPPGIGKSMFISYSIGDFLLQKKNVLLVSMEMSNFEFIKRIDSDLLSIPIYELKNPDRRNEITEKLESLKGSVGELYVQNYAPGSFSAYSLEALLDLYASNNIKIDVVMLDYLGLMKSDRVSPNVGLYSYIKSIGEEVRAVAKNHRIATFTASQLNRSSVNKDSKEVDNSAISDSLGTAMTADLIVMLIQTERQKENNEITFKITKNRYTGLTREFKAIANYKLMRFEDMLIPQDGGVASQFENKTPQEQAQAFDFNKLLNP